MAYPSLISAATAGSVLDVLGGVRPARSAERLLNPGVFQPSVRLALHACPQPLRYEVATRWEERRQAEVTRTIVQKQLTLSSITHGPHLLTTWATAPPRLRKPDLLALEEIVLLLAGLYQRLVVELSTAGEFLALANHAEVVEAWAVIEQELLQRYGEEEELIAALRAAVEAQVQEPALLLSSLRHDYAYRLLVANLYQQRFESGLGYTQPQSFPHFLAGTALHFHERLELGA
ncbi:MAG: hypothetical protein ACRYGH_20350, partial [Janthinobacterium lividum]